MSSTWITRHLMLISVPSAWSIWEQVILVFETQNLLAKNFLDNFSIQSVFDQNVLGEIIFDNYIYTSSLGKPSKENILSVKYQKALYVIATESSTLSSKN